MAVFRGRVEGQINSNLFSSQFYLVIGGSCDQKTPQNGTNNICFSHLGFILL